MKKSLLLTALLLSGCAGSTYDWAQKQLSNELPYPELQARKGRIKTHCEQSGTPKSQMNVCIKHTLAATDATIIQSRRELRQADDNWQMQNMANAIRNQNVNVNHGGAVHVY